MTSLANEVATLKTKVANLESRQSSYATKSELASAIEGVRRLIETLIEQLRKSFEAAFNAVNELLRTLLGRNSENLEGRVKELEIRVSGLEGITDSIRRAVENLQRKFGRLESDYLSFKGYVNGKLSVLFSKVQSLENTIGQMLMDIKNLYSITTRHEKSINDLWGQIRLIWAAIALLQIQVAGLIIAIAKLLKLFKALPLARNGLNGRNGANGKDGSKGANGRNGANGINGKDGKDLKMEYSNISVKVFTSCDTKNKPVYATQNIQVIKGTEALVAKEFDEISKMRGSTCSSCCADTDGEIFGLIDVSTIDKSFTIPSNAQKIIIEFREIKSYVSKRFSSTNPKYKRSIGTISFLEGSAQSPDIHLQYQKMIIEIPKAYKNNVRYGYIYLQDCKATVSFWKSK